MALAQTSGRGTAVDRDYVLSDREFERMCRLVRHLTGISLSDAKRDLVYSRFAKRLRALKLKSFDEYCELVESSQIDESQEFANAITTNLTAFFREAHHFDILANVVIPDVLARSSRRFRVWSAGSSTGEEAYSIAMTVLENWSSANNWDIKILGTDLDSNVVATANGGVYDARRIEGLPTQRARRWFSAADGNGTAGAVRAHPKLRDLLYFKRLNLMDAWPMRGPFEVIFCRNTVIYFDKETQRVLFDRFADLQRSGDYLFLGHSETLHKVCDRYELIGQTVYRKVR